MKGGIIVGIDIKTIFDLAEESDDIEGREEAPDSNDNE